MTPTLEQVEAAMGGIWGWLSQPHIVGMYARSRGARISIVVHVVSSGDVDRVPREVTLTIHGEDGKPYSVTIPTEAIAVGENRLDNGVRLDTANQYKRPCPGGYQIQGADITGSGTLGVSIEAPWAEGAYCLLSCNHVISQNGKNEEGAVYQPNSFNAALSLLASVTGVIHVYTYPDLDHVDPVRNRHDLAWCRTDKGRCSPVVHWLNKAPRGFQPARAGDPITVVGSRTDTPRESTILSTTYRLRERWSNGEYAWFEGAILLAGDITASGDSGAAYLHEDAGGDLWVVGMHVGANDAGSWGCAFPISLPIEDERPPLARR